MASALENTISMLRKRVVGCTPKPSVSVASRTPVNLHLKEAR